jgi:multiple sugar transport system permease protein
MAKRVTSGAASTLIRPAVERRPRRLTAILGPDWKVALPFILPLLVLMVGLILWPFINALLISFTTRSINRTEQWVGLMNYVRLWTDSDYRSAVNNTISFTVISVACKLVVGMAIALLLNSRLPFRNVLTGLMLLPWIVPEVVTAMAWRSIYDPIFGGLNPILMSLGLIDRRVAWLAEPQLAMPSVIAVNIWKGIPFFTMLLLAGLKAIDKEL